MYTEWLFRHVESAHNLLYDKIVAGRAHDSEPTDLGRIQAPWLGKWIRDVGILPDVAYASPAVRTLYTGRTALLAAGLDMELFPDDRLQEMTQGTSEGMDREDVYTEEVLERIRKQQLDFALPEGESMRQVAHRVGEWSADARAKREARVIMAFTHGVAIRCRVAALCGWGHAQVMANHVGYAGATRITYDETGQAVDIRFNIPTLAPDFVMPEPLAIGVPW